jgi:hypothetical protein
MQPETPTEVQRKVHHADALQWLGERPVQEGHSLITSLPDFSEFPSLSLEEWKSWFTNAAALVLSRTPANGVAIFYQRDAKRDGAWVDKAFLIQKAAEAENSPQLWHKIVCRAKPGSTTFGKPGYSHLLCFSKGVKAEVPRSTPDVIPEPGDTTWTRGMGLKACEAACRFVLEHTDTRAILDPFCGHGTVLAVANSLGLSAIGVEKGRKRAEKAERLVVSGTRISWRGEERQG